MRLYQYCAQSLKIVFKACGLHVSRQPLNHALDTHLMQLFDTFDINCVLDVGAHYGEYGSYLRRLHYRGYIISFEPCADSFMRLRERNRNDKAWFGYQWALSDNDSTAEMHMFKAADFNSLHSVSRYGKSCQFHNHLEQMGSELVMTRRLDTILPEVTAKIAVPRIYLKCDTQGHDACIIDGAAGCLDEIIAFQTELAGRQLYDGVPDLGTAINKYQALGYLPTGFFPVTKEPDKLTVIEWDGIFIRAC